MAQFQKQCKKCGKVVEYDTQEEVAKHFYKKVDCIRNVCKECELSERKIKYRNGTYNYTKPREEIYRKEFALGSL